MRSFLGMTFLLSALLLCSPAYAFDCNKLDFGSKLSDIDDGNFVMYQNKDGVAYYNYTGICRLQVHQRACPAISYAFVDGVYYARIIRVQGRPKSDILKDFETVFGAPDKKNVEGSSTEYIFKLPKDVTFKFKYDESTGIARTATYANSVREKLRKSIVSDPVDLSTN